jgi:SAM-dependent methyltransferase
LAPWHEIGDDQLSDYYAHYLTEEYKHARTEFQPGFAQLGQVMGSQAEALSRRKQHQDYVLPYLIELRAASSDGVVHLLDHGGGEGLIIPDLSWVQGSVHDVESDQPAYQEQLDGFDFVQCLHVLEHVGHPLRTYAKLVKQCRRGGLIYIEVPVEFPGIEEIKAGNLPICHEHINKFCLNAIAALQQTAAVEIIGIEIGEIDFLHLDGMTPVIRGLARKL